MNIFRSQEWFCGWQKGRRFADRRRYFPRWTPSEHGAIMILGADSIYSFQYTCKIQSWTHIHLVGGIPTPLKNISQLGWWNSQYMEIHKIHVPNHQPVMIISYHFQAQDIIVAVSALLVWWYPQLLDEMGNLKTHSFKLVSVLMCILDRLHFKQKYSRNTELHIFDDLWRKSYLTLVMYHIFGYKIQLL